MDFQPCPRAQSGRPVATVIGLTSWKRAQSARSMLEMAVDSPCVILSEGAIQS